MAVRVLVVDDDPVQCRLLEEIISRGGYSVVTASNGEAALDHLSNTARGAIEIMILDLVMPDLDGMGVLERMRERASQVPVIVQTAQGGIQTVVSAMRAGATDFVVKPVNPERLLVSIKNALKVGALQGELTRLRKKAHGKLTFDDLIAGSQTMVRTLDLGKRAAASNIPILLEGESGVGKELIARAIQGSSARKGKPFVTVNCGAIPDNLVESILFGHEKGAFTGATSKHVGKFMEANGGTLFLDEVGELPSEIQVKLLRALQDGEIDPVGANASVKVDIRLISATNRDLIEMVHQGEFREDLYYRLNVFPILIPPLRDRMEDVPALVRHFIARFAAEEGKKISGIDPQALQLLSGYSWPGNIRQLENALFRAVVLADGDRLTVDEFPQIAAMVEGFVAEIPPAPAPDPEPIHHGPAMIGGEMPVLQATAPGHDSLGVAVVGSSGEMRRLEEVEADMIRLAISRYDGHMSEIARRLGIGRSTLYRKVRELGLEPRAFEAAR
ncbi:MAG: sigma-54-dependent transcriptional regulator [Alphaproteobacteria bacterium]